MSHDTTYFRMSARTSESILWRGSNILLESDGPVPGPLLAELRISFVIILFIHGHQNHSLHLIAYLGVFKTIRNSTWWIFKQNKKNSSKLFELMKFDLIDVCFSDRWLDWRRKEQCDWTCQWGRPVRQTNHIRSHESRPGRVQFVQSWTGEISQLYNQIFRPQKNLEIHIFTECSIGKLWSSKYDNKSFIVFRLNSSRTYINRVVIGRLCWYQFVGDW